MVHGIHIEGIKLYGYHGCLDEAKIGGHYIVDVCLGFSEAAKTDDTEKQLITAPFTEIAKAEVAVRNKLMKRYAAHTPPPTQPIWQHQNLACETYQTYPPMNGDVEGKR